MRGGLSDWVLWLQLLLIVYLNCHCALCFQGLQGDSGPKGDPGPYGQKGGKVRSGTYVRCQRLSGSSFGGGGVIRHFVLISGRSWQRRWSRKAWKLRTSGTSGKSVQRETREDDKWQKKKYDVVYIYLWQGDRGPGGANGDKGERGDDVSNNSAWHRQKYQLCDLTWPF